MIKDYGPWVRILYEDNKMKVQVRVRIGDGYHQAYRPNWPFPTYMWETRKEFSEFEDMASTESENFAMSLRRNLVEGEKA